MSVSIKDEKPTEELEIASSSPENADYKKREAALVRKLDLFIAPVMMLLMLISYLDRGNIGFASTQGMSDDIGLVGSQLNIAISVFYIFYILAEFPTSLLAKRMQFGRVIPAITFCWGIVCMCNGFIQNFASLVSIRLLLGFFEGCLFPCLTLFMCDWYKREELGIRISYLFIASALSTSFGGLLAFAILYMDGAAGIAGWRWLYIIEGIITIVWAGMCYFLIPRSYETAYFLNDDDKAIMKRRAEISAAYSGGDGHYGMTDIKLAALDPKTWIHGCIQIFVVTILYGFGTFLPIILKNGFNFTTMEAQYLVIPVGLWGAIVYAIGATLSDKYSSRFLPPIICAPIGILGYAILLTDVSPAVQYFATYLVSTACFLCTGSNITWLSGNCAPDGKRAASVGILLTLTNIGGIIAGQIYQTKDAPSFTLGHGWSLASLGVAWCAWWGVRWIYTSREAEKAATEQRGEQLIGNEWTDRSPGFKYQI